MANGKRGYVTVILDGEERRIRFGTNELIELENQLGAPWYECVRSKFGFQGLCVALAVGIRGGTPGTKLKVSDVAKKLRPSDFTETLEKVIEAIQLAVEPTKRQEEQAREDDNEEGNGGPEA